MEVGSLEILPTMHDPAIPARGLPTIKNDVGRVTARLGKLVFEPGRE